MSDGKNGWWSLQNAAAYIADREHPKNKKKRDALEKRLLKKMKAAAVSGELKTRVNH